MRIFDSYHAAFRAAVDTRSFAAAHLRDIALPMNIDTTGCHKLFYFLSGKKRFHIDSCVYDVRPGDLFFINQRSWHYFSGVEDTAGHERMVIFVYPEFLRAHSTGETDLCGCFSGDEGHHRRHPGPAEREVLHGLLQKLNAAEGYGGEILALSAFLELAVTVNRIFRQTEAYAPGQETVPAPSAQVKKLLRYMDSHITGELTLETLSREFYLTPSYLCRIFRQGTGTTIHQYLTAKRITLAKELLGEGFSVTEACSRSGFKDYNGFLKAFVRAVGVSPKKYASMNE